MIEITKNKLVSKPICEQKLRSTSPSSWGDIHGDIQKQEDLIDILVELEDKIPSLDEYAKKSELPVIPSFKTINGEVITGEGDIEIKGGGVTIEEVDEEIDSKLTGYAKLTGKNTFTGDTTFNEKVNFAYNTYIDHYGFIWQQGQAIALKSEIPSLGSYATKEWVGSQGYINNTRLTNELADYAKLTGDSRKFEGQTYFGDTGTRANMIDRSGIYLFGSLVATQEWVNNKNYALKSELPTIPTFKTINGETITGTGDIVIQGGGADLPDYLKDGYIEITDEYGDYTQITPTYMQMVYGEANGGLQFNISPDGMGFYNPEGFGADMNAWGMSSSSPDGSWSVMGTLELPGEQIGNGILICGSEEPSYLTIMSDGISFWDFDQTTEEGEVDWEHPTIQTITKEELLKVKLIGDIEAITNEILS